MSKIETPSIKQKVLVKGYVGSLEGTDRWYVFETVNYVGRLPGETVTRKELDQLIREGVQVTVRRK